MIGRPNLAAGRGTLHLPALPPWRAEPKLRQPSSGSAVDTITVILELVLRMNSSLSYLRPSYFEVDAQAWSKLSVKDSPRFRGARTLGATGSS